MIFFHWHTSRCWEAESDSSFLLQKSRRR
jgi:hypothetical protein